MENTNGTAHSSREEFGFDVALTPLDDWQWQKDDCFTFLLDHFKVKRVEDRGPGNEREEAVHLLIVRRINPDFAIIDL